MFKIALVGRPNVGKSTLFNRLVGKRLALVSDEPGMTRDRKVAKADLFGLSFQLTDTAGLFDPNPNNLTSDVDLQTHKAIEEADLVLFMMDGLVGCTPYEYELAKKLRKYNTLLIVNKMEGKKGYAGYSDAMGLGFDVVVPVSAAHGEGLNELYDVLANYIEAHGPEKENDIDQEEGFNEQDQDKPERPKKPLRLAIVGQPNVGKSTLMNALLGEERVLVADQPGVTRDSIEVEWSYKDRAMQLIDTAGLRRHSKVQDPLEKLSILDTKRSIQFAEVAILVVDARHEIEKQDLTIAYDIVEEGRALVIALNQWDCVKNPTKTLAYFENVFTHQLSQANGVSFIPISALKKKNLDALLDQVLLVENLWNKRIKTAQLNQWLREIIDINPPPAVSGRRLKLKYMTQIKTRPPTFVLFSSKPWELPTHYQRFLINRLRKDFDLPAVPIRLTVKTTKNPYAE